VFPVSRTIDRFDATFDHDNLVANAGLIIVATLMSRLGLEQLANRWVHTGSFLPGRKIGSLVAAKGPPDHRVGSTGSSTNSPASSPVPKPPGRQPCAASGARPRRHRSVQAASCRRG